MATIAEPENLVPIGRLQDLPLEDAIREKLKHSTELNVLVIGCYQVGKSTLINSLFHEKGKKYERRAKEGAMEPCTKDVKPHLVQMDGISYNFYDSPGLQDGTTNDVSYLRMIKKNCKLIHLLIYCTKMGEPVRPGETAALKNITITFGEEIWENAVIALTFANNVQPVDPEEDENEYFDIVLKNKIEQLHKVLFRTIDIKEEVFENLMKHVYPAGSARVLILPGTTGDDWRVDLWVGALDVCLPEGKGALLKLAWKNPRFIAKAIGATAGTASGGVGITAGVGCVIAGAALTATGILAPVGVTLIIGGAVSSLLGIGAGVGGVAAITSVKKEWRKIRKKDKKTIEEDEEPIAE